MRSNKNIKKINLGILLGCLICSFFISQINQPLSSENKSEDNFENNVKTSLDPIYNLTGTTIYIDNTDPGNDWAAFQATYAWCTGDGSALQPYTISQVLIDGSWTDLIIIRNSDVHFSITWCDLLNGDTGIYLDNVTNGMIKNNQIERNEINGIFLTESNFNNLSSNTIRYNKNAGIVLGSSSNNLISENIASYNEKFGIRFTGYSNNNNITKNTLTSNYNTITWNDYSSTGIKIYDCEDNFISENTIKNHPYSIKIDRSNYITFTNNELYDEILLMMSTNITFSKNALSGVATTILLFGTTNSMFIENELSRTNFFIKFQSNYNSFIGNVLLDSATAFYFKSSSYNKVINNSMYRANKCFEESEDCLGNVFEGNYCQEGIILPPLDIIGALIGSIAVAGVTVFMFLKRRKYIRK